jgi:sporulation protein YlmC with PRC-barrel domain
MRLSDVYHLDVYSDRGQYLGDVQDIIVDLEHGEVSRLLMGSWKSARGDVKSFLKQKSILYKNIKNVGDVVMVSGDAHARDVASREELNDLAK